MTVQQPLYMQELGYPARLDRQLIGDIFSAGVKAGTSYAVSSSGGARSVNVAEGSAFVEGTHTPDQGTYRVFNDDTVLLTHDTAVTFARLDMVILRIYDTEEGDVSDSAVLEIVKGAEAAGTTLANRNGVGTLPPSSLLLADVLVPTGSGTVIPSANINDRRAISTAAGGGGSVPIGGMVLYTGSGDLPDGTFVVPDGRLIDKTAYGTFYTRTGHKYNGGVDPGNNKVRIPDKRGRMSIGAINMGTGAGTNDNAHAQFAAGSSGGEVNHTLSKEELPPHAHFVHLFETGLGGTDDQWTYGTTTFDANTTSTLVRANGYASDSTDSGLAGNTHNNLPPYETDCLLVRIA